MSLSTFHMWIPSSDFNANYVASGHQERSEQYWPSNSAAQGIDTDMQ